MLEEDTHHPPLASTVTLAHRTTISQNSKTQVIEINHPSSLLKILPDNFPPYVDVYNLVTYLQVYREDFFVLCFSFWSVSGTFSMSVGTSLLPNDHRGHIQRRQHPKAVTHVFA